MSGDPQFAENLIARRDIPIAFWDERLSTAAVERLLVVKSTLTRKRRKEVIDKTAAAYILQGALDAIEMRTVACRPADLFLILMGWTLHRYKALEDGFWAPAENSPITSFFRRCCSERHRPPIYPFGRGRRDGGRGLSVLAVAAMALARVSGTDGPAFPPIFKERFGTTPISVSPWPRRFSGSTACR